jgi:hypothetical protein
MLMNSNTALVIFAMVAMLGLATVTLVIPNIPQVQAIGNSFYGRCNNPFSDELIIMIVSREQPK